MKKVIIIGSPGAGKSTLARRLSAITGLPVRHLDLIWHRPDRTMATREEFDTRLAELLKEERWILDGTYIRTLPLRLHECDTVIFLDYPLEVCLAGVTERLGRQRDDMPWVENEIDPEFLTYVHIFPTNHRIRIRRLLAKRPEGHRTVILHNREEADEFLASLTNPQSDSAPLSDTNSCSSELSPTPADNP